MKERHQAEAYDGRLDARIASCHYHANACSTALWVLHIAFGSLQATQSQYGLAPQYCSAHLSPARHCKLMVVYQSVGTRSS